MSSLTCLAAARAGSDELARLLSDAERAALEDHLASCDSCSRLMDQLRTTVAILGSCGRAEALAVHRDLRARLLDELGVEPGPAVRDAHLEILRDQQRLARHPHCPGRHQVIAVAAHHQGLPTAPTRRPKKATLSLSGGAPRVEVRELAVYEALAQASRATTGATGGAA